MFAIKNQKYQSIVYTILLSFDANIYIFFFAFIGIQNIILYYFLINYILFNITMNIKQLV